MSSEENKPVDLMEAIKTAKVVSGDDPVDFSWPDGFLSAAKSLQSLPNDKARIQGLTGMANRVIYF